MLVDDEIGECQNYIKKTEIENLHFIPRGTVPPNPSELLDSPVTKKFIATVAKYYDIIIFDGTPINGLTDSLAFTKYVDKVIVVSACNYTKIDVLENTIKSLKNLNVDIAGVILNKVPNNISSNYYYYYGER